MLLNLSFCCQSVPTLRIRKSCQIIISVLIRIIRFVKIISFISIIPQDQVKNPWFRESMNLVFRANVCSRNQLSSLFLISCLLLRLSQLAPRATTSLALLPSRFGKGPDTRVYCHLLVLIVISGLYAPSVHCVRGTGARVLNCLSHKCLRLGRCPSLIHSRAAFHMRQSYHWLPHVGPT